MSYDFELPLPFLSSNDIPEKSLKSSNISYIPTSEWAFEKDNIITFKSPPNLNFYFLQAQKFNDVLSQHVRENANKLYDGPFQKTDPYKVTYFVESWYLSGEQTPQCKVNKQEQKAFIRSEEATMSRIT